jgi:hypothetical protein
MYIPNICINLFSITKALSEGWKLSNHGLQMVLSRANQNIEFDQILKTAHGYVCGVTMLPFCDPGGAVMELALRYLCPSPLGGESTSNFFSDNAHSCSKYKYENFVLILLDGNPSVARQKCTFTMKGYTGQPTFRKAYEHTNGIKENTVWCMMKKNNDRKKLLDKRESSSNVQNIMVNKILSYIEVICHNKSISNDTDNSYQHPMFISAHNKTLTWQNGEQRYKHGETMSKHWSYPQVWHLLKPILFYSGDTGNLIVDDEEENEDECQVSISLPVKCNQGKPY